MARRKKVSYPEQLKKAYDTVMSFPEGMRVLRHILTLSGYNDPLMHIDPQSMEVNKIGTITNVAKRDMWFEIRKYLRPEHQLRLEQFELVDSEEPTKQTDEEALDE